MDERRISQQKHLKIEELTSLECPGSFSLVSHWPSENGRKGKVEHWFEEGVTRDGSDLLLTFIPEGGDIFKFLVQKFEFHD